VNQFDILSATHSNFPTTIDFSDDDEDFFSFDSFTKERTSSPSPLSFSSTFPSFNCETPPPRQKVVVEGGMPALLDSDDSIEEEDFQYSDTDDDDDEESSPFRFDNEIDNDSCLGITPMSIPNNISQFATPVNRNEINNCLGISPICIPTELSPFAIPPVSS